MASISFSFPVHDFPLIFIHYSRWYKTMPFKPKRAKCGAASFRSARSCRGVNYVVLELFISLPLPHHKCLDSETHNLPQYLCTTLTGDRNNFIRKYLVSAWLQVLLILSFQGPWVRIVSSFSLFAFQISLFCGFVNKKHDAHSHLFSNFRINIIRWWWKSWISLILRSEDLEYEIF